MPGSSPSLKVLFVGGSGVISSACSALAVQRGLELHVLNRGSTSASRPLPEQAVVHTADIHDPAAVRKALGDLEFDAVVDWVAFTPQDVRNSVELLAPRTRQYVFISSASAYQTPPARLPITESTPLRNPFWPYSQAKIACEDLLVQLYREQGLPVTIIRPSHTYDRTLVPLDGGWTVVERMRAGKPVVVHGDGSSLWTLTHHTDFARGFVPLLGHPLAVGEAIQITGEEAPTWDRIAHTLAEAAGVEADIVHVPSDVIAAADPAWGQGLLGDKTHSATFDTSKLRSLVPDFAQLVPFHVGAREIVRWHDADPARRTVDPAMDAVMDDLVARMRPGRG